MCVSRGGPRGVSCRVGAWCLPSRPAGPPACPGGVIPGEEGHPQSASWPLPPPPPAPDPPGTAELGLLAPGRRRGWLRALRHHALGPAQRQVGRQPRTSRDGRAAGARLRPTPASAPATPSLPLHMRHFSCSHPFKRAFTCLHTPSSAPHLTLLHPGPPLQGRLAGGPRAQVEPHGPPLCVSAPLPPHTCLVAPAGDGCAACSGACSSIASPLQCNAARRRAAPPVCCSDETVGYGISSTLYDHVFSTMGRHLLKKAA